MTEPIKPGRPPLHPDGSRSVTLWIPRPLYAELRALADRDGIHVSQLLRIGAEALLVARREGAR